jgi:hypothetical protein
MKDHVTSEQLKRYQRSILPPDELLAVDDHLAECPTCRSSFGTQAEINARALIEEESEPFSEHLGYDEMAGFVDGDLDKVSFEIVAVHLEDCSTCFDEVEALRSVRIDEAEPSSSPVHASIAERLQSLFSVPVIRYGLPAAVILSVSALLFDRFPGWRPADFNEIAANVEMPQTGNASVPPIVNSSEVPAANADQPQKISLKVADGNGTLEIGSDGRIIGSFAGDYDPRIEAALRSGTILISPDVGRVRSASGTLMGSSGNNAGLKINSPIGRVLVSDRPVFSWSAVPGAESYTVEVFDSNFSRVASSPSIKLTRWQASGPLPRGREYSWQVSAVKDGETLKAPVRPAPEAKFFVLSREKLEAIERAKRSYGRSGLVMGLAYAEAGLLDEAEREFATLLKRNPGSEQIKRLLNKVRSAR